MSAEPPWLDQYGNAEFYKWRTTTDPDGRHTFHRPLGLVESAFDSDGRYHQGRADINAQLDLKIKTTLDRLAVRDHVLAAWTLLRNKHPLIQAKAVERCDLPSCSANAKTLLSDSDIYFAVSVPASVSDALASGAGSLVWLEDYYESVDPFDFYLHAQNTARAIDPSHSLAKLFVFSLERSSQDKQDGTSTLRFLMVGSHQIQDGLTSMSWMRAFLNTLNSPPSVIKTSLEKTIDPATLLERLPLPQEALYPSLQGSRARQRWFWLLTRILRHVRRPHPPGFANPLVHPSRPNNPNKPFSPSLPPKYAQVLNYTHPPPIFTYPLFARASPRATRRLHTLCRRANVSIGSGCFALAALLMMDFHSHLYPDIPLRERKPFITGFPLNPRPFLSIPNLPPESLSLAFSDGILLPYLPSDLPLGERVKLLAKVAHKQLSTYQKRLRPPPKDDQGERLAFLNSRGPGRMLQIQYLSSLERASAMKPPPPTSSGSTAEPRPLPQQAYPARPNATQQTCGVSSVGNRSSLIRRGLHTLTPTDERPFTAEYLDLHQSVRARENEFLVGVGGAEDGLFVGVSVDASALNLERVREWGRAFEGALEGEGWDDVEGERGTGAKL